MKRTKHREEREQKRVNPVEYAQVLQIQKRFKAKL